MIVIRRGDSGIRGNDRSRSVKSAYTAILINRRSSQLFMLLVGHVTQLTSFNCYSRFTSALRIGDRLYGLLQTSLRKNLYLPAKGNECSTAEIEFAKVARESYTSLY